MVVLYLTWIALGLGAAASTAALYGHYRVLPSWLTGPEICLMEDGGCAVLFRSPRSRLLGVPNALLGMVLYALLAAGLVFDWPPWLLFVMVLPAITMSLVLAHSLITRKLQCRICWTGHLANAILFVMLGAAAFQPGIFHLKVETTRFFGTGFFGTGFLGLEARLFADTRSFRLQAEDPDALYKQRENIPLAQRAEQIWAGRLAKDAKDFESA